jgi:hypothetical protein
VTAGEDARALEAAIAALAPDALDGGALAAAEAIARRLAGEAGVGALAEAIARTLRACGEGVVEPHTAQWRLAAAALTLRQERERVGGAVEVAIAGACHELETLFPRRPESPVPPRAEDVEIIHPGSLVRRHE